MERLSLEGMRGSTLFLKTRRLKLKLGCSKAETRCSVKSPQAKLTSKADWRKYLTHANLGRKRKDQEQNDQLCRETKPLDKSLSMAGYIDDQRDGF